MLDSQLVYREADVVWDIRREYPQLFKKLTESKHKGWLKKWLEETERTVPSSKSYKPFVSETWYRPVAHARAMYQNLDEVRSTLCIKGTEAYCSDVFGELEQSTKRDMYAKYINQIEWWIRIEQKSPFVFSLKEGLQEARIAAEIQIDYFEKFGRFAKLPIPIKLFKIPDTIRDEYLSQLKPLCDPHIRDLAEFIVSSGLGAYNYLYEGDYRRLNLLWNPNSLGNGGYRGRKAELKDVFDKFDINQAMKNWVGLTVDLLSIGWIPTNYNADFTGQMVRHVNAFLDGGFADLDSARRISEVRSDQDFYKSFWFMIGELTTLYAFATYGFGKFSTGFWASNYYAQPSFGDAMCATQVWERFTECVNEAKQGGCKFDDRIELIVSKKSAYEKLDVMMDSIFPEIDNQRPFTPGSRLPG